MAIPDFQSIMLPMLRLAQGRTEYTMREIREDLAQFFRLTPEELAAKLPSGHQGTFANRVAWAKTHLTLAGLLASPKRGILHITSLGKNMLANPPNQITCKFLQQFPAYQQFLSTKKRSQPTSSDLPSDKETETPEEVLEAAYERLRAEVAASLLQHIKDNSWEFFEHLVVKLLVAMGYGGSFRDAGQATRKTGDGGIDGVIKQDRLGLDSIYLQAKRWENVVGRPEIQKFVGALHGQRAKKGVFITTSHFSTEAKDYAEQIDPKIVLIDGAELVELMIDHNLGVSPVATYVIKKVDTDFFAEEY
ncbi:MAG: restriction endonuclease [Desulfovibrionales bacterium]|nr:restriction endonuclease [Desulfovibrionales bacterium]